MPIDWFTVIAQVFNFLILVWLLKRFLYQPILHAIDAREKQIADQLQQAAAQQAAAQQQLTEFQHKNDAFEKERESLLNAAVNEARTERQRLLDEARAASESLRARLQEALGNEQLSLNREITARTRQEVFAISRKVLADLAGASIEQRMAEVFIHRLRELGNREKTLMRSGHNAPPMLIRSAFDLPAAQQAEIENAVREILASEAQIHFEVAPDLVCGIELTANSQKLAWSIADYLGAMEQSVAELLQHKHEIHHDRKPDDPASR